MILNLPKLSLVVLIGASGSGKSSFARRHFLATEIVSSDGCRGLVSDDENDQSATPAAFELVHFTIEQRLKLGRLTVVDATNVQAPGRQKLIEIARKYHVLPTAIVFDLPERICHERNRERPDRQFGPHVVRNQVKDLHRSTRMLRREGFRSIYSFTSVAEIDEASIVREPLWNDKTDLTGPFDIIGDVHGCLDELIELLEHMGYQVDRENLDAVHPDGRTAIYLGDLVDRGPNSPGVLKLVMRMVESGSAFCVPGNHDIKLLRHLRGSNVSISHGLDLTIQQLSLDPDADPRKIEPFLEGLVGHLVLDGGKLVVAHAGMPEAMQGRGSAATRDFALFGETSGETDEFGLPIRYKWATDYRGAALVAYGHTPVPRPEWLNNTVCLDTGCVFGGRLSALRYPEREIVSVAAHETYATPVRPIELDGLGLSSQHEVDDILDVEDVRRRMHVRTRHGGTIVIAEENATAALEIMSRFAANPKWLVYLPPTMSPCATSRRDDYLEHPEEAFAYFRDEGLQQVVLEEKHMGSRATVVVCRSEDVARDRFGVVGEGIGIITTRTGRRFFDDAGLEQALLQRIVGAMDRSGLWSELQTDWIVLDAELMPWSAKAQRLIQNTYAPVGVSGRAGFASLRIELDQAKARMPEDPILQAWDQRSGQRQASIESYIEAYRRYCWPVSSLEDYKLAPFHILATETAVHVDKTHVWHMETIHRLCAEDTSVLRATPFRVVGLDDEAAVQAGVEWCMDLTSGGGEGMVTKPLEFMPSSDKGRVQPAIKCRGPEYLRIIYGAEYLLPENLVRLRARGLARKRSLASREFALGIEALQRFVDREPLRRVHECVFGVLALESEPVDPRL